MAAVRNKSNNEISLTYSVHVQQMVSDILIFPETFLRMATDDSVNSGDICRRHFNAVLILQKCCENCFQLTLWMHLIYVTFHMLPKKYDCKKIVLLRAPKTLITMLKALSTIRYLILQGCKNNLLIHLGAGLITENSC